VIPGMNYSISFYTYSWCPNNDTKLGLDLITNATWFNNVTNVYGYDFITSRLGNFSAKLDYTPAVHNNRTTYNFTAYDRFVQLKFTSLTGLFVHIDTIQVTPILSTDCDSGLVPLYSYSTPSILYHFCENPATHANPSFEDTSCDVVPCGWTQSDSNGTVMYGRIGYKQFSDWYQSGLRSFLIGNTGCQVSPNSWSSISYTNWMAVVPRMMYTVSFFAYRACFLNTYVFLEILTPNATAPGGVSTILADNVTVSHDMYVVSRNIELFRTFIAPPNGLYSLRFTAQQNQQIWLDTIQVKQSTNDPLIYMSDNTYTFTYAGNTTNGST